MGYNSDILFKDGYVCKTLGKHLDLTNGASLIHARRLKSNIIAYEKELRRLKITHPTIFDIKLIKVDNDGYNVFTQETAIEGTTLDQHFSDKNVTDDECLKIANSILSIYQKIRESGRKIAIDPPLQNFILSKDSQEIYYIDLMPPRQQLHNRIVLEYPGPESKSLQEYNYLRHFTDYQFQSVYVQFCKYRIHLRREFETLFRSMFSEKIYKYISTPYDLSLIQNLLRSTKITSVDFMRNIALELWYQSKITKSDFDKIYLNTHIMEGSGQIPTENKMDQVSKELIIAIAK